jgi:hypothetical protein
MIRLTVRWHGVFLVRYGMDGIFWEDLYISRLAYVDQGYCLYITNVGIF